MEFNRIQEFYNGRSIFVTGFTGLVGKAIVEKLLRCCPKLEKIYVLVRSKKGVSSDLRLQQIFESPTFDAVRPALAQGKVVAVEGDLLLENLGLSSAHKAEIIEKVSVVVHSAANVKFNEVIDIVLETNYYPVRKIINLCDEIKNMAALVYISTAYSTCNRKVITESIVPMGKSFLQYSAQELQDNCSKLVGEWPNTYTLSKSLAENLLLEESGRFPIAIARPSISSWKEPVPGYIDSVFTLTGLMVVCAQGFLSCVPIKSEVCSDMIPLDVVVNAVLAIGWCTANTRPDDVRVYNICSTPKVRLSFEKVRDYCMRGIRRYPPRRMIRYPRCLYIRNERVFKLVWFVCNIIPSFFADVLATVMGKKRRFVRLNKKMLNTVYAFVYFMNNEWTFHMDNLDALSLKMSPVERKMFYWDIENIDWRQFYNNYCYGVKRFIFKEEFDTTAQHTLRQLYFIESLIFVLFVYTVCKLSLGFLIGFKQYYF